MSAPQTDPNTVTNLQIEDSHPINSPNTIQPAVAPVIQQATPNHASLQPNHDNQDAPILHSASCSPPPLVLQRTRGRGSPVRAELFQNNENVPSVSREIEDILADGLDPDRMDVDSEAIDRQRYNLILEQQAIRRQEHWVHNEQAGTKIYIQAQRDYKVRIFYMYCVYIVVILI